MFIVGDHGPYFFRNLKIDNEKLYIDDRYATIGIIQKILKLKKNVK